MLDHISLGVSDLAKAAAFYDAVLSALGYVRLWSSERGVGYGKQDRATNLSPSSPSGRTRLHRVGAATWR